jgi:hypothetical protein
MIFKGEKWGESMRIVAAFSGLLAVLGVVGCANLDRTKVEKLDHISLIRVETPPLHILTAMQAYARSPQGGGLIPGLIAESQERTVVSAQVIPDIGVMVAESLRDQLPRRAAWWPRMTLREEPVKSEYANSDGAWLRLNVTDIHIAPWPIRTLRVHMQVSLRSARNEPMWVYETGYSSDPRGVGQIDLERLAAGDFTQLQREITNAARSIVDNIASQVP